MHYRHSFHAGNFADVVKHVVLCALLAALRRKDAPFCYVETHAGAGRYELAAGDAERSGEWRDGIGRLAPLSPPPGVLADYLGIARAHARRYPGSPLFAAALLRPGDRMVLCERQPATAGALRRTLAVHAPAVRAEVHVRDGYEAHALLPPKEKRGLVMLDPPFERRDEFQACGDFLEAALARFAGGIYAAWYPLKNRHEAGRFERRMARAVREPPLAVRFETGAKGEGQMRSCAMLVLNAPFGLRDRLAPALDLLTPALARGPGARGVVEAAG